MNNITFKSIIINFLFLIVGASMMYGTLYVKKQATVSQYKRELSSQNIAYSEAMVSAMNNLPSCEVSDKVTSTDPIIMSSIIDYNETHLPILKLIASQLSSQEFAQIFNDEITRETNELAKLNEIYKTIYGDYIPNSATTTLMYKPDLSYYATGTNSNEVTSLDTLRGQLNSLQKNVYSYALVSENDKLKKVALDFNLYAEKTVSEIIKLEAHE